MLEALEAVHVLELKDRDFTKVSDGQRQRILLARALCQEPELIVLDEPTSFLDIRYKLELLTVLKRMVRENDLAVLLTMTQSAVSHQLRILRDARLVKSRKQGRIVYYSLDDDHIDHIFAMAFDHIMEKMEG